MPGLQRILVVSTTAADDDLRRLRTDLGRDPVVVAAPTPEAERVTRALGVEAERDGLLGPVSSPRPSRGEQLNLLVRRHALEDRFRDVVVVTDVATATLLLRNLAPDQLATGGAVTLVGLPRGDRQLSGRRAVVLGILLSLVASVAESRVPIWALPAAVALVGVTVLLVPVVRHVGRELLVVAGIAMAVSLVLAASSARFPGGW